MDGPLGVLFSEVLNVLVVLYESQWGHLLYRCCPLFGGSFSRYFTFSLKDSLGGNAKTNLVANVHPNAKCFGESLSTLNFARRAKMIQNKAVVNEDATGNVLQLQTEIRRLREQLERFRGNSCSYHAGVQEKGI